MTQDVTERNAPRRSFLVEEPAQIPWLSVVLGYGAAVPFVAGAVASWFVPPVLQELAVSLTLLWAGTILAFLSGVRRGLSFRTSGGPTLSQIAVSLGTFGLAFVGMGLLDVQIFAISSVAMAAGFAVFLFLDPIAARHAEAPLFFERLRPPQMLLICASLIAVSWRVWMLGPALGQAVH